MDSDSDQFQDFESTPYSITFVPRLDQQIRTRQWNSIIQCSDDRIILGIQKFNDDSGINASRTGWTGFNDSMLWTVLNFNGTMNFNGLMSFAPQRTSLTHWTQCFSLISHWSWWLCNGSVWWTSMARWTGNGLDVALEFNDLRFRANQKFEPRQWSLRQCCLCRSLLLWLSLMLQSCHSPLVLLRLVDLILL